MIRWLGALVVCSGIGLAGGGDAEPITLDGLTFSDELGGVRLEQGWGSGSLDDPIVLVEEITGDGPAILIVRGMTHRFGNRIRSHHEVGFALTKLVRNGTGRPWTLFNVELREFFDHASPFGDGLSFGQASDAGRPFASDRFVETIETREPFDGVEFADGLVEPGETVALSFVITDTTPRWEFYLLQKRDSPLAGRGHAGAGLALEGGASEAGFGRLVVARLQPSSREPDAALSPRSRRFGACAHDAFGQRPRARLEVAVTVEGLEGDLSQREVWRGGRGRRSP